MIFPNPISLRRLHVSGHLMASMQSPLGRRNIVTNRCAWFGNAVDAYRNKMRSTMLAAGQEPASIPRHFETRAGKRQFLERKRRTAGASARGAGLSASQRSAEEVEA